MSISTQNVQDIALETVRSAPPVAITTAMFAGISVSDWAAILTIIYVILQVFFLCRRELRAKKKEKGDENAEK